MATRVPLAASFTGDALSASARLRIRVPLAASFTGDAFSASARLRIRVPLAASFTGDAFSASARLRIRVPLAASFTGGALSASARLRIRVPLAASFTDGALSASARLRVHDPLGYVRAIRASTPTDAILTALEVSHPAVSSPVRIVNDTVDRIIEGERYVALRFGARLVDDVEGQVPRAEVIIDNIGRELMQWIEAAQGGVGATVRVMQVLDEPYAVPEWEMALDVASVRADQERVSVGLGFDPLLGRAAVTLRHDPQTSPGLF